MIALLEAIIHLLLDASDNVSLCETVSLTVYVSDLGLSYNWYEVCSAFSYACDLMIMAFLHSQCKEGE